MTEPFQDPELFLSRFAGNPRAPLALGPAQFMHVPAAELSQLSFLDTSELDKPIALQLALEELVTQAGTAAMQHTFGVIYHSAFCCSTHLARCLETVGVGQALKEPYALTQLAFYHADESFQQFAGEAGWSRLLRASVDFISRPLAAGGFSLVKSHNFCIVLATEIARLFPGRVRSVFIWSDLHSFLVSVLKSPARRSFVRRMLKFVSPAKAEMLGIPLHNPASLDDGAAAAYCWLLHMAYYRLAAGTPGADQSCSLDCDALLRHPESTLARLSQHFGLALEEEEIHRKLHAPGLRTHAKEPARAFSAQQRLTDLQTNGFRHRREIKQALAWFDRLDLPMDLRAGPGSSLFA